MKSWEHHNDGNSTYHSNNTNLSYSVQWLVARKPTEIEVELYGLKCKVPIFLPAEDDEKYEKCFLLFSLN